MLPFMNRQTTQLMTIHGAQLYVFSFQLSQVPNSRPSFRYSHQKSRPRCLAK
ncbi:uncharacterized protein Bfra_005936 [Botrytis fragariae]|uniref:Uncharacterized protein n=1 Tax=Botrytis fragariae TaxID=1964551 RepID=A0A8H6ASF1_9HELO|nr:uncharacterized protein Bfra_005936 [Botrytis fragariae]KAF5872575.1 hypothetical protein Bfra_005936 [Botrytis fragariae]